MKLRSLGLGDVLIIELHGALEERSLYQIARHAQDNGFQEFSGGRIYDIRKVNDHVGSLAKQIQAVSDWLRKAPDPRQQVVFVSHHGWAVAANRIVRRLLHLDTWHVVRSFDAAFKILEIEADAAQVARQLAAQPLTSLDDCEDAE